MKLITLQPGHNATVGFFEDGECKYILHEEKFNNIKNYSGWPEKCLEYLAKKINFSEIDYFVFGTIGQVFSAGPSGENNIWENIGTGSKIRKIYDYLEYRTGWKKLFTGIKNYILYKRISPQARKKTEKWLRDKYKIPPEKIKYFDHHLCHCLTPVYFYGLNKIPTCPPVRSEGGPTKQVTNYQLLITNYQILLISMDGAGDYSFSKIFIYDPFTNNLQKIADSNFDSSLGVLYSEMTQFLGMKANEHEYKVMGLAAYVDKEKYYKPIYEKLKKIVWLDKKSLTFKSRFNTNVARLFFKKHFSEQRFDNLACALQKLLEELVLEYIQTAIEKTGIKTIALSGGVFMNVKMNQKILEIKDIKKVYFQPSCGDDSLVVGAAGKMFLDNNIELKPLQSMYFGLSYSNKEIKGFLEKNGYFSKYEIKYFPDIEKEIARLLADFQIVAIFSGKGEWGARSLGNRAILGNAKRLETFYEINDMIKMRDFWMPFAPTILEEWAEKYIKNWKTIKDKAYESTKYMILTFDSTLLAQKHLHAAIHQKDKTLRPQIVDKEDNENLYRLLKYYEKLTGMGGVIKYIA